MRDAIMPVVSASGWLALWLTTSLVAWALNLVRARVWTFPGPWWANTVAGFITLVGTLIVTAPFVLLGMVANWLVRR